MKNFILTCLCICACITFTHAQEVNGKILLNRSSNSKLEMKGQEVVNLYAQLRGGDLSINFQFEGNKLPTTTAGKQVSLIQFKTTVKHNGREIANMKRSPMPFFPGDMLMPIETFDLITILTSSRDTRRGTAANAKLAPGKYEVIFEATALDAKGSIKPATLVFEVR